jgi:predicted nucleotidyltransferase
MQREFWTNKLARIVADIEAGKTPSPVRELYVFGSYAHGALECRDLDLVVIHDPPTADLVKELMRKAKANPQNMVERYGGWTSRFDAMMRRVICRPGEEIDLLMGADLDKALDGKKIKKENLYLVWSSVDRDWEGKLSAIRIDPSAGPAPRDTFISPKLAEAREEEIIQIGNLVRDQALILTKIDIANLEVEKLTPDWLELFSRRRWGKRIQALIPPAFAWLGLEKIECIWPTTETGEIWEMPNRKVRIQLGRFQLYWMLGLFKAEPRLTKQCLVPHFRRAYPKELFVFERGPNWASFLESEKGEPISPSAEVVAQRLRQLDWKTSRQRIKPNV